MGLLFDNSVVITSILFFQPVQTGMRRRRLRRKRGAALECVLRGQTFSVVHKTAAEQSGAGLRLQTFEGFDPGSE